MKEEVEKLFHELADLSPEARDHYFAEHFVDGEIRRELEQLLAFDSGASAFLRRDVGIAASKALPQLDPAGYRCGPYRLLKPIGRGGMGTVYLAERADGEVVQRVAVKFLTFGGDTPNFRDRFLQERQILATLSHHGIARLLDAGHTADARPYLALEYVDGVPIDAFAEKLDLREKFALFLRVCDAVSYAHRNLVIHRDLKPSNILVDASGEPKLLDFGIAKMLDAAQEQTQTQERVLTPEYASPEQTRGAAQTTATDVYSLGAVLYKLLTGRSPHASDTREGLITAICTANPVPPSRLKSVPRDLDFVVAKALRKEPEERYRSVEALADDLRAYLEFRPVRARSGDAWYRTRKFVRRYWVPVAAAAMVVGSLAAGLYAANRERAIAERRFAQVRHLANQVLALDSVIRVLPGSTKARQEVIAISQEYLEGLAADARQDQTLAVEAGAAYFQLARAQGLPTGPNLGEYAQAEKSLKKADALLDSVLKKSPRERKALLTSAEVAEGRMILASSDHRREEAFAQAQKAAARVNDVLNLANAQPAEVDVASRIFTNIALMYKNTHLYQDSIRYAQRATDVSRSSSSFDITAGNDLSIIADSLRYSGDLEGALRAIREARTHVEKAKYPGETFRRATLFSVLWRQGTILGQDGNISLQRPAEAIEVLQQAFDLTEEWAQRDPHDARSRDLEGTAARELGRILQDRDPKRALAIYEKGLLREREIPNSNRNARREEARLLAYSSYPLRRLNRAVEAGKNIDSAFAILQETKDYPADRIDPDGEAYAALRALGDHLADTRQMDRAVEIYHELLDKSLASNPDALNDLRNATRISDAYSGLAALDRRLGRSDEAAALDSSRRRLWDHWSRKLPQNAFVRNQIAAIGPEQH